MKKAWIVAWILVAVSFLISAYFYQQMPERMVTHWGTSGEPNGYMNKGWGLLISPLIMAGLAVLFMAIPRIDPLKQNVEKFAGYFEEFVILILAFLLFIHLIAILWNIGVDINIAAVVSLWLAALFFFAGRLMRKSERNWFIGIRTPWTLSSDTVWKKTNESGGKLFQASAFVMLLGVFLGEWFFLVLILLLAITGAYIMYYSYSEYQKEQKGKTGQKTKKK